MEKTVSVEERIKRAEEIYNRRASQNDNIRHTYNMRKKNNPKSPRITLIKKMIIQIVLCFFIYAVFYVISNSEYIFSEDFRRNMSSLLNTQMNFDEIINNAKNYFSGFLSTNNEEIVDNLDENQEKNSDENLKIEEEQGQEEISIGGANEENLVNNEIVENSQENLGENVTKQKSQMEIDAEDIKKSISFEVPVQGYISSKFGLRNPTTDTVPKNHTGLDIAAASGTVIKSATDGTVTLVSSYGDYGKHYKIQIEDVVIIYAHCSKLYLKEGDTVTKGQSIAEVGSTGNSTGPHLHFEIRKDGRLVDPQLILNI